MFYRFLRSFSRWQVPASPTTLRARNFAKANTPLKLSTLESRTPQGGPVYDTCGEIGSTLIDVESSSQ